MALAKTYLHIISIIKLLSNIILDKNLDGFSATLY